MAQPKWKKVGTVGDVNWPEYDGGPVMVDETGEYQPELEYVETPTEDEDFESPRARWTVYRVVLDPGQPWGYREDLESVAETSGQDPDELANAFKSDDPMERAYAYETWAGHFGWHELDHDPLTLTCAEVNKRYPHAKINCYGAIQTELEEEIERMVDESAAHGWSHVDDRLIADLQDEGYDPESIIVEAEFGDAIAVNEDLLVGPHWASVLGVGATDLWSEVGTSKLDAWLEANGYDYLDKGGRVPSAEGYAYAETVIDAVANKLDVPYERVVEAAEALDQWQDEIPGSSSGGTYVWAKKKAAGAEESRRRTPASHRNPRRR